MDKQQASIVARERKNAAEDLAFLKRELIAMHNGKPATERQVAYYLGLAEGLYRLADVLDALQREEE